MQEIRLHGLGGQGVVTTAKLLAAAALKEGKFANSVPAYGHERRGAPVFAYVRLDDQPIPVRSFVYAPDCVLVLDASLPRAHGVDVTPGAGPDCIFVVNSAHRPDFVPAGRPLGYVNATAVAVRTIGLNVPNTAMLGAFAAATGWLTLDAVCSAISDYFAGEAGERNVRAAREAYATLERLPATSGAGGHTR